MENLKLLLCVLVIRRVGGNLLVGFIYREGGLEMVVYRLVGSFAVVGGEGSRERGALSWWGG